MAYQPKSYRKFLATTAAAAMVATVAAPFAPASVDAASNKFSDVKPGAWYVKGIDYLVEKGALNGYEDGTFKPNNGITRAEVAKVLVEALGLETESNPKLNFSDTKNDAWYAPYVAALVAEGVIEGNPDGTFQPNAQITRAALAKMVVEAYDLEAGSANLSFPDLVPGAWYVDYIKTLASNGIVEGKTNGKFEPNATVTRAEAATFVHRTEVPSERVGGETVTGAVKVINNTTVEVTLAKAVSEVKASDFSIDGLEVTNAVVKQTDNRVVVLTTAAQEGGKNYTVKFNGATVGTFTGVAAVIPEKIDVETDSIQGIVGQQVTLKADIGVKAANVPVTFNVDAANNSLNKDIVEEVLTDADGIATFTYTQYNAGFSDDVAVYPTGAPATRDFATVFWGVDTILKIEADDEKGNDLNNGENKVYKITYKDPKTGKAVADEELNITFAENVDVSINKITHATANGKTPYQLSNNKVEAVTVKTDSKGEATVTVSGTNTKATPVVFLDGSGSVTKENNKLERTELQVRAAELTFGSVHLKYEIEVTRDGGEEAAIGSGNGRVYKVVVKDENGKAANGEVVNVAFDEVLDRVISTNTEAYFLDSDADDDLKGKSEYYNDKDKQQITLKLDSKGEGEFRIVSEGTDTKDKLDYATPVVWIDINTSSNKDGVLEEGEPKKVAAITYFAQEKISGSSLKVYVDGEENKDNRTIEDGKVAEFRFAVANQSGKKISPARVKSGEATFAVKNTGNNDVIVFKTLGDLNAYLADPTDNDAKKKGTVVSRDRKTTLSTEVDGNAEAKVYIVPVNGETATVEVTAYGEAKDQDDKIVRLSESKLAKATFKSSADLGSSHTGVVEKFNKDKKKIKFENKKELDYKTEFDDDKVSYIDGRTTPALDLTSSQFEKLVEDELNNNIKIHYFKGSDGKIKFTVLSVGNTPNQGDLTTVVNAVNNAVTAEQVQTALASASLTPDYSKLTSAQKLTVATGVFNARNAAPGSVLTSATLQMNYTNEYTTVALTAVDTSNTDAATEAALAIVPGLDISGLADLTAVQKSNVFNAIRGAGHATVSALQTALNNEITKEKSTGALGAINTATTNAQMLTALTNSGINLTTFNGLEERHQGLVLKDLVNSAGGYTTLNEVAVDLNAAIVANKNNVSAQITGIVLDTTNAAEDTITITFGENLNLTSAEATEVLESLVFDVGELGGSATAAYAGNDLVITVDKGDLTVVLGSILTTIDVTDEFGVKVDLTKSVPTNLEVK